jgi:putative transposase
VPLRGITVVDNINELRRRSIRLKNYDYSQNGAYFITICTFNRELLFGNIAGARGSVPLQMELNEYGKIVYNDWYHTPEIRKTIILDQFVVMPNHIHGIIIIAEETDTTLRIKGTQQRAPAERFGKPTSNTIPSIIRGFKSATTARINRLRNSAGNPVWQRNYYEHVIRNDTELSEISEYILYNPAKWAGDKENPEFHK